RPEARGPRPEARGPRPEAPCCVRLKAIGVHAWLRRSRPAGPPPESSSPGGSASFAARAAAGVLRLRRVLAAALLCVPLLPAQAQTERTLVYRNVNITNCASSNCVTVPSTVTWHGNKWGGVYKLRYTWDFSDGPNSAWTGILTLKRPYRMRYYQTTNTSDCSAGGGQSGASNNSTFSIDSGTSGVYARPGVSYCMVFGTTTGDYRTPGGIALAWIAFITPAAP
ncbi:MAG: hypothetical protein OXN16_14695, partial [Gammaproteobacteria bacterium]|nr:hypothetical protein [Gammaproteobacteria bacterium]